MISRMKISQVAFIIFLLAAVQSCTVGNAVDRGLYSVANAVSSEDLITGRRKLSAADREKQIAQGNAYIKKLVNKYRKEGKKINEDLDANQYYRALGIFKKVHAVSHLRNEKWDLYLVPEDSFNAYTTGGTAIVVNLGLMKKLAFDDEVAAVIAHEIAHVAANHVFERQATMMAGLVAKSKTIKQGAVQAAYSHNDEAEADKVGILYDALAGYDPMSASRIWAKIYRERGNNGQSYQDHPISSERLKNAKDVAEKVEQYYIPGRQNPNFEAILFNNSLYQKQLSSYKAGSGGGVAAVAETLANYYAAKQNAKKEAFRQSQRIGVLKDIQSNMKIVNGKMLDNGKVAMLVQYTGSRPIGRLAIKAVSPSGSSIYRHNSVVHPNEKFTAQFSGGILKTSDGSKPKIKLVVDEGKYF